ncbi:MAG: peroxidase [Pseudomonadota bacterium]
MTKVLDLLDIQGNVVRAYGRFRFPVARYVFFNVREGTNGRAFVAAVTEKVTTSVNWGNGPGEVPKPLATLNIAFTYQGLKELDLPAASLVGFTDEFMMGMKARKDILGDDGPSAPEHWDTIWKESRGEDRDKDVHVFISINGQAPEHVESTYQWLLTLVSQSDGGVVLLRGHRGDDGAHDLPYQDVKIVLENGLPTSKEHFGYTDGIGDPVFEGLPGDPERVQGRGKQMVDGGWAPLATGEFLLGHIDEAHEYPPAPNPILLSKNGTYMVYRKLHENVATFDAFLDDRSKNYPGGKQLLAAKFVGRWMDNGAPLVSAPDAASKEKWDARFAVASDKEQDEMLSNFTFNDDASGAKCPFSGHIRRINPRGSLEVAKSPTDKPGALSICPGAFDTPGALANRRRILRRGLPYGEVKDRARDDGNHGIIIMMLNADINRQFEFVQQQWINYGNDFRAANDKEIILGNHNDEHPSKAVIQVDPDSDQPPYFVTNIPRLVETRGGDYFFIPSMTALRLIAKGLVDPT